MIFLDTMASYLLRVLLHTKAILTFGVTESTVFPEHAQRLFVLLNALADKALVVGGMEEELKLAVSKGAVRPFGAAARVAPAVAHGAEHLPALDTTGRQDWGAVGQTTRHD